ncbi:MAG TPA: NAD(P)-dependent oxidoreductase [Ktedonobacter sp.]|jgi:3-hydroxyisobutyrate dehydrogenase|nr:NAD(P)-dependent oxidoreductase [Ktedonobacter sp.]
MNTESNKLKPSIGFIGMGHMGSHMVQRLLDAGYQVTVYDRTKEKAQELEHRGALVAQTPKELAANCQVVMACVTNDEAQQEVMFGPDGALAGVHAGSVIIDLSTVSPDASRRLFQAAKEQGVSMIDAAVSGSVPQVDQGSLVIFVGGEHQTYQQCKPILDVLGHNSFFMGASGMGTTMKLVVNTLLGLGMQALAEAIALGEKAGVEKGLLLDVLGQTAVLTPGQKSKLDNVKREQYPTNFALSLMHKDFSLVLSQAYDVSVSMPATAAAQQMYAAAMAKGMDADFSIMIQFMEELAGLSTSSEELRRK